MTTILGVTIRLAIAIGGVRQDITSLRHRVASRPTGEDLEKAQTMKTSRKPGWVQITLCGLGLAAVLSSSTGCQVTEGGQTLPSPYYLYDDVQYFPPCPEFKLSREAAALKQLQAEEQLRGGQ
jgi:hypothetical protein